MKTNPLFTFGSLPIRKPFYIITALIIATLYIISLYNYLVFHTLVELFSVVIVSGVFIIAWNSRHFLDNDYFLFIGIGLLAVGFFDLFHTLAYKGLNIFADKGSNTATQLWIAARYFNAFAFLLAPIYIKKKLDSYKFLMIFAGIAAAVFLSIFYLQIFPTTYIDGIGLTAFKKISEYIITIMFLVAAALLFKNRENFDKSVTNFLTASLITMALSEIFFTLYVGVYDFFNLSGHLLKVLAFIFIYRAMIVTSLRRPYSTMFRNLRKTTEALRESETKFRSIIESASDAIILSNSEGNIIFWNNSAEKIFGYKEKEILNKPLSIIMPEQYRGRHSKGIEGIRNGSVPKIIGKTIEIYGLNKEQKEFPVELSLFKWEVDSRIFFGAIIRDVSEKRLNDESLKQSESKFRNIFEQSPVGKEIYDSNGKFIDANKAAMEIFGISRIEEEKQFNLFNNPYISGEEKDKLRKGKNVMVEYEFSFDSVTRHKIFKTKKTGTIYINEFINPVVLEKESDPQCYLVHIQDVTEKVINERKINHLATFPELNIYPIIEINMDGKIIYANPAILELFPDIETKGFKHNFFSGIALEKISEPITREISIEGKWHNQTITYIPNENSIRVYSVDITKRKKYEKESEINVKKLNKLANDLEKFKLAIENASDLIVITNAEGKIIYANNMASQMTGFSKDEIIGQKSVPWGGNMPKEFYQNLWHTIKVEKKPFLGELINSKKNGEKYNAEVHISPVLDENQNIVFFVGIGRDITKAKEIDRAKSEFISMASHQLRTPLASTSLSIELLLKGAAGEFNEEQKEYLKQIYADIWGMAGLIDAFLNVSRIELGIFILDPKPTDMAEISNSAISKVRAQIEQKNIKLEKHYQNHLPEVIVDPTMMKTAIENLLTNAVKYTPEKGKITVEIEAKKNNVVIAVSDTGCGIPKDQQKNVFKKLFRASNALKEKTEGMGLGLYVVKSVIEKMGGKVWFKSIENNGTSFYISIPISK